MERKFYTDNFEQLLKEKSDEFRMYPSKRVWHSIYNDLHPGRKWPSVAVSMILIIALLMTGYWNNKSTLVTQRLASSKNIYASGTDASVNNSAVPSGTIAGAGNNTSVATEKLNAANSINTVTAQQTTITSVSSSVTAPATYVNRGSSKNSLAPVHARRTIIASSANTAVTTTTNINSTSPSAIAGNSISSELTAAPVNKGAIAGSNPVSSINKNGAQATAGATIVPVTITSTEEVVVTSTKLDSKENRQEEIISVPGNAVIKIASPEAATTISTASVNTNIVKDESKAGTDNTPSASQSTSSGAYKKTISTDDKAWIEDYAFHNKSKRKKWQDRTAFSFYLTPGAVFGKLSNDAKYNLPAASPSITNGGGGTVGDANNAVSKRPGLGIEGGFSINYSLAKKLLVKAGIQANITSYGVNAYETNHPVLTTLMLIDPNSGFPYMHSSLSTLSNIGGSQPVVLHNQTFQVSIPLGFAFKLWGNDKLAWYTGATIQPSFVAGGKAYLISADRNNYVADPSLIRKWNLNTGIESYITYKFDGFSLQAGPQYRRQLMSTYYNKYTVNEKLSNVGIKLGLIKNF